MASQLSFEIITHDGLQFQADVYEVILPTADGEIGVLAGHEPLISVVVPGVIAIRRQPTTAPADLEYLATSGGFIEVNGKVARLLADATVHAKDVDEVKIREAIAKAEQLKSQAADEISYTDAVGQLELQLASLKLAHIRRTHRRS